MVLVVSVTYANTIMHTGQPNLASDLNGIARQMEYQCHSCMLPKNRNSKLDSNTLGDALINETHNLIFWSFDNSTDRVKGIVNVDSVTNLAEGGLLLGQSHVIK